ncbi:pyrroline-5-carboxylate reductase [Cypionkella aquatica]|uniref:Pyrroline-5-carboxylate reductase n=1 Tax=Cypionkella aquatica TaxID=1756042 RepID=A0AA37X0T6_9RHOB|nr:pyrroline-5-carboxylate reductase [Cypionkella aquatica]GLS86060.1 pyrroline-5-carboxylate reductase [Cypionkella aquatica]
MRLGFIGTGTITAHMVRGLKASGLADWPIVLSPRGAEVAAALAELPGVRVAASNQAVVEACDLLVLAVRPQIAEAVIKPLKLAADLPVLSLVAGLHSATIGDWLGPRQIARAIPLPFVETHQGVTPVFPPAPAAMQIFAALGTALPVDDLAAYDAYAAGSALMGSYFGLLETASAWMQAQGLPETDASAYLRGLFGSLGDVLRGSSAGFETLREDHSTKGGLNEMIFHRFVQGGGGEAMQAALTAAFKRVQG